MRIMLFNLHVMGIFESRKLNFSAEIIPLSSRVIFHLFVLLPPKWAVFSVYLSSESQFFLRLKVQENVTVTKVILHSRRLEGEGGGVCASPLRHLMLICKKKGVVNEVERYKSRAK